MEEGIKCRTRNLISFPRRLRQCWPRSICRWSARVLRGWFGHKGLRKTGFFFFFYCCQYPRACVGHGARATCSPMRGWMESVLRREFLAGFCWSTELSLCTYDFWAFNRLWLAYRALLSWLWGRNLLPFLLPLQEALLPLKDVLAFTLLSLLFFRQEGLVWERGV